MSPVCPMVVPSVSEESPSATDSGVLLSQDPSAKPVLLLPPKKPAAFSGDHEETPVKQLPLLKQPPALPPKPTARIANHLTGESRLGAHHSTFPSRDRVFLFGQRPIGGVWVFLCVSWYMQLWPRFVCLCQEASNNARSMWQESSVVCLFTGKWNFLGLICEFDSASSSLQ